jgi:hypothetical protein
LYVTTKKLLTPTRIDNTKELVGFIKETAQKESNWKDKSTLEFRMALGARRDNDPVCTKDFLGQWEYCWIQRKYSHKKY